MHEMEIIKIEKAMPQVLAVHASKPGKDAEKLETIKQLNEQAEKDKKQLEEHEVTIASLYSMNSSTDDA